MNCNLCCLLIREMEFPGRNTAESNALHTGLRRQFQAGTVTVCKQFTVLLCHTSINDRPYRVKHIFAWQIKGRRDFRLTGVLLMPLLSHQIRAVQPQLDSAAAVNDVVDAGMTGHKTAP